MSKNWFATTGIIWTLIFAGMSFYWAAGGMIGVRSLGGEIYQKALNQDPSFIPIVWATGVVKLLGAVILWIAARNIGPALFVKWMVVVCIIAGIFMILYGILNFITISLAALGVLDFNLDAYAIRWRLIFWEPFWVLGGIFYLMTGLKSRDYCAGAAGTP